MDVNVNVNIVGLVATTLERYDPCIRIRLRFLVTSRTEPPVVKFFTELHIPSFDMSTVDREDMERYICIFLEDELQNIVNSRSYEPEEKENDIRLLAKISGGVWWGFCCSTYRHRFRAISDFSASKAAGFWSYFRTRCCIPAHSRPDRPRVVSVGRPPTNLDNRSFLHSTLETSINRPSAHSNRST